MLMVDRNCQSTVCSGKNCQDTKYMHMWPVKAAMKKSYYMQLVPRPAMLQSNYKKKDQVKDYQISMNVDKNCQSTVCFDMNCHVT